MGKATVVLTLTGRAIHDTTSFLVFCFLDLLDLILCFTYKVVDFFIEAEWRPCYCTSPKDAITSSGKILVTEKGESTKVVCLNASKLELEDISDTLYARSSLVSELSRLTKVNVHQEERQCCHDHKIGNNKGTARSSKLLAVNSTVVEMLQGKIGGQLSSQYPIPRWSDCDCKLCNSWSTSSKETLHVKTQFPKGYKAKEDVLFIHGFISSSAFWTETLFPNFSSGAKSTYRFFAIDLLGFGRSPKPTDSLYTVGEHLDMIERSVLEPYNVKSFHIVAHSLGCVLALALAVKHPKAIKSLTLLAPPYYPVPKGVQATQYVMRKVAPRRVWPPMALGASMACWYEHISRTICLLICKNHRVWEFLFKLVTRNRVRTFLAEGFFCHTHNAAWHTLHNIICGGASKLDIYLAKVSEKMKCDVNVFHGKNDEVIPVECSLNVQKTVGRARVKVIENKDHITIVVGRQKEFALELEEIWKRASSSSA